MSSFHYHIGIHVVFAAGGWLTGQPLPQTMLQLGQGLNGLVPLAFPWGPPPRREIGATIVEMGFLSADVLEAEARAFHDDLEVVEVIPRSERTTLPIPFA